MEGSPPGPESVSQQRSERNAHGRSLAIPSGGARGEGHSERERGRPGAQRGGWLQVLGEATPPLRAPGYSARGRSGAQAGDLRSDTLVRS